MVAAHDMMRTERSFAIRPAAKTGIVRSLAVLGAAILAFEVYVWLSWILGAHFVPTDPGPDRIPARDLLTIHVLQWAVAAIGLIAAWFWIMRPSLRAGHVTTDAMLAICCWSLVFYDPSMNFTSVTVLYNAYSINWGAWTLYSWPSWTSPNGNTLAEPIVVTGFGYLCLVFCQVLATCWAIRKLLGRFPALSVPVQIIAIVFGMTVCDSVIEILLLRTGIYAYPGGIREITLFAGQTYQFPLSEGLTFGGMGVGAVAVLRHFKDDRGLTIAEHGIEQLRVRPAARQWIRFLSLFGFTHSAFIMLFAVPNQWLATHSGPFPKGYPSYMTVQLCAYGDTRHQCPGPGISMPRPLNNPL
ncbi:MAG: hypothetical protein JWO15_3658 [Sphingomonadales bacterium]|nr:hypothetical protein [Sphingomonadales bacterium]